MKFDAKGREIPNPIPAEIPLNFRRPPTLQEQIKMYVRRELSMQAADDGHETFEEADDFEVDDDYDPSSPYEENFDVEQPATSSDGSVPAAAAAQEKPGSGGDSGSVPRVSAAPPG